MQIGLMSDTHVPHRMRSLPSTLHERFSNVDLILHAGDLDDPAILDELGSIAPVQAVRGNIHFQSPWPHDQRLPLFLNLDVEGHRILLTHGHLSLWNNLWEKLLLLRPDHQLVVNRLIIGRLARVFPGADVYVFGHTHRSLIERRDGALFVNPGAVCSQRRGGASAARMTVSTLGISVEILWL
jgi:putative phosphoesterase